MTPATAVPSVVDMDDIDDDEFICSICGAECGFEWDDEYEQEVGGPSSVSVADDGTEIVICDDCAPLHEFRIC